MLRWGVVGLLSFFVVITAVVSAVPLSTFESRSTWPHRGVETQASEEKHESEAPRMDEEIEASAPVSQYKMPGASEKSSDTLLSQVLLSSNVTSTEVITENTPTEEPTSSVTPSANTVEEGEPEHKSVMAVLDSELEESLSPSSSPSTSPSPSPAPELGKPIPHAQRVSECQGRCGEDMKLFTVWTTPTDGWMDKYTRSIDSALFHHPKAKFTLYSSSLPPDFLDDFKNLGYDVHMEKLEMKERAKGTPLEPWVENMAKWHSGPYYYAHLSDAVRLLVLFLEGGVYFDTDIIFVNPIDEISNSVGWERPESLCNAVMSFDKNNSFVGDLLHALSENYSEVLNDWAGAGPALMTGVYQRNYSTMDHPEVVHTLDRSAFYPVSWDDIGRYFEPATEADKLRDITMLRRQSFTLHYWNSRTHDLHPHPDSLIQRLFDSFCVFCGHIVNPSQDDIAPLPSASPSPSVTPSWVNATATANATVSIEKEMLLTSAADINITAWNATQSSITDTKLDTKYQEDASAAEKGVQLIPAPLMARQDVTNTETAEEAVSLVQHTAEAALSKRKTELNDVPPALQALKALTQHALEVQEEMAREVE